MLNIQDCTRDSLANCPTFSFWVLSSDDAEILANYLRCLDGSIYLYSNSTQICVHQGRPRGAVSSTFYRLDNYIYFLENQGRFIFTDPGENAHPGQLTTKVLCKLAASILTQLPTRRHLGISPAWSIQSPPVWEAPSNPNAPPQIT